MNQLLLSVIADELRNQQLELTLQLGTLTLESDLRKKLSIMWPLMQIYQLGQPQWSRYFFNQPDYLNISLIAALVR